MSVSNQIGREKVGWPEMLRRWFVRCPRCAEVWLIVGAREDTGHVCKGCGHGFVIRLSTEQAGDTPAPKVAAGGRGSKFE
jgi:uncharacterized protein (DUF983 family)